MSTNLVVEVPDRDVESALKRFQRLTLRIRLLRSG